MHWHGTAWRLCLSPEQTVQTVAEQEPKVPVRLDKNAVKQAEDQFRRYLRRRGLKFTPERRAILRAILSSAEHFEAEDLLLLLRQQGKRIGKATIYRTLPLLVDCGILKRVFLADKRAHYEHSFGPTPHDHMVCQSCGRIVEFDSTELVRLRERLAAQEGFKAISHRFQILGICPACAGEAEKADR